VLTLKQLDCSNFEFLQVTEMQAPSGENSGENKVPPQGSPSPSVNGGSLALGIYRFYLVSSMGRGGFVTFSGLLYVILCTVVLDMLRGMVFCFPLPVVYFGPLLGCLVGLIGGRVHVYGPVSLVLSPCD
jgi:membrane-associated protease RseP (regulator of RpoE activity)